MSGHIYVLRVPSLPLSTMSRLDFETVPTVRYLFFFILLLFYTVVCFVLSSADVCEDVDTKACELMVVKRPDLCSDPCLSKLCPRYCKRCRE